MKLAILSSGYLQPDIEKKITHLESSYPETDFIMFDYKNFSYISELYKQIYEQYDGFIITGLAAYYALEKAVRGPLKPMVALDTDLESLYFSLLNLITNTRSIDFNKVLIDVLLPQNPSNTAATVLSTTKPGLGKSISTTFWESRSLDELISVEKQVFDLILQKWEQGQVDYVLSRYSTLLPLMEEMGIPCSFIYPTDYQLSSAIKECLDAIAMADMKEYMPAVAAVFKSTVEESIMLSEDMDIDVLALQKALLEFNKEYVTDYQLQKYLNGFYIFTNLKTVNRITNHLTHCSLSTFLKKHLNFQTDISYGFAKDMGQAKSHAASALKASIREHHVYAINEAGSLIGPLDTDREPLAIYELTPLLEEIASRSHLSPLTIQRLKTIIDANDSPDITIAELSDKLGVKQRNANRILSNLLQSGDAEINGVRTSGIKGRPTKVYRLSSLLS